MNRRDVLKSAVSLAGAGTLVGPADGQSPGGMRALTTQGGSYVGTRDGQQLFYQDWGAGDPVVFLAGWALPFDMWDYQKVPVPTLVIHGDGDVSAAIDLTGRPTARMIPGAVLKVYDGAPHGLFLTHMARLTEDILGFARA
jgi:pimeloyl-ACP methyl ester carboxylesterase